MITTYSALIDAVGSYLNEVGTIFYTPDGVYPTTLTVPPAYAKRIPVSAPSEAVALIVYDSEAPPTPHVCAYQYRLQVRVREPYDADPLADQIMRALVGTHNRFWGDVRVQTVSHLSTAQLGLDDSDLDERTDNYLLIVLEEPYDS